MVQQRYKRGELTVSFSAIFIGLFFLISSFFIPTSGRYPFIASVKIMPILLSVVLIITSIGPIGNVLKIKAAGMAIEDVFKKEILLYIGALFLYIVSLFLLPFWLVSITFLIFSFMYWKSLPIKKAAIISIAIVLITMTVFSKVFYINFS